MNLRPCSYKTVIKISGIYDIVLLIPFFIPLITPEVFSLINKIHIALSLNGDQLILSPASFLFVNIMAAISILWGTIRFISPTKLNLLADTIIRLVISLLMLYYLLTQNVSEIIWIFLTGELSWAIVQVAALYRKNETFVSS